MLARRIAIALIAATLSATARADYDAGMRAYEAGDYSTALREFRVLADRGIALGYTNLGYMHAMGEGVTRDLGRAAGWFRKAAEAGVAAAQATLGVLHYHGEGVPKDLVRAYAWLSIAAAAGRDDALDYVALLREEMAPEEIELGHQLGRRLLREYGDPEARKLAEDGWFASSAPDRSATSR